MNEPPAEPTRPTRPGWLSRLSWVALVLAICALLGMFVMLSFYAHPQTDDFGMYDDVRDLGVGQTIVKRYTGWTGRYFYMTVEAIVISQMDLIEDFWMVGLATMSILLLSMVCFMRTATLGILSRWQAVGLSIGLFAVYCALLATPSRAFFWLTGAATNQLVLIMAFFAFALLLRDPSGMGRFKRGALVIGSSLCISGAIASYDNTIPMLGGMLLVAAGIALYTKNPRRLQLSVAFVVAVISAVIVVIAPGNEVREAHFERAPLMQAIDFSITNSLKWLIPFLLSPTVLLASLLFLPLGWRIGRRLREITNGHTRWMLGIVALWALMIVCSWFPAQYIMQGNPPPRTINTTSMFTLIGVFGSIAVFCAQAPLTAPARLTIPQGLLTTARFAFAAVLLAQGNGIKAFVQLRVEVQPFHQAMHERYAVIREAKARGKTDVVIPPLPVQPTLLLPLGKDITGDPIDYPNFAACRFWELDTIRMAQPAPPAQDPLPVTQPASRPGQ
ncbi:MAG: DUF6056 family protein [Planctomycetota bacterium]